MVGHELALVLGAPLTVGQVDAPPNEAFIDTVGNLDLSDKGCGDVVGASLNKALGLWLIVGFDV